MQKYYPGLNRLLVKKMDLPETKSLLSSGSNLLAYGEIIAIGSIKDDKEIDQDMFNIGDRVYFLAQAGMNIDLPEDTYRLITITDILVGETKLKICKYIFIGVLQIFWNAELKLFHPKNKVKKEKK